MVLGPRSKPVIPFQECAATGSTACGLRYSIYFLAFIQSIDAAPPLFFAARFTLPAFKSICCNLNSVQTFRTPPPLGFNFTFVQPILLQRGPRLLRQSSMSLSTAEILFVVLFEVISKILFASEWSEMACTTCIIAGELVFCFCGNMDVLVVALKVCRPPERSTL